MPSCEASPIRKDTIRRFPYLIAFEGYEQYSLVLAIVYAKRRPLYWLLRSDTPSSS